MLTSRKVKAQATRQTILDAAEDVFFEKGLSGTSLEEIAQRSGVTRGAIYWHFTNKIEVFEAVLERTVSFYESLLTGITQKADSLRTFEDFTVEVIKQIAADRHKQRALCILMLRHEWLPSEPRILAASEESSARILHILVDFFARMQASGLLHDNFPAHVMAETYQFYVQGLLMRFLRHPESLDLEKNTGAYTRLFFSAFETPTLQEQGSPL